ncbi:MAG: T9SS type A sorting domain-containing protein, partial [Bacteroidota bacterium]
MSTGANYEFNGSVAQVTGALMPATVNNLTVSNSAGVSLSGATSVTGTLTFSNGNLAIGANNLTLAATVAGTLGASKHIVTDGAGKVVKNIAISGSFTYPVGYDASTYNPVTVALDGSSTADDFSVKVSSGVNPAADNNAAAVGATWDISEAVATGSNATLTFQWTGAQEGGSFTRATAAAWHHNGSNWVNVSGGTTGVSDPYTMTTNSTVSSFSPFIVGNDGALPVEIAAFTASAKGKNVELKWNTATEINNHGFEIERSVNGTWNKIGFVEGAGTSNSVKNYGFVDAVPVSGKYSYRLKQIDNDGRFTYSSQVEATVAAEANDYTVSQNYPNPFNPSTKINFTVKAMEHATMKIYDITGREVATLFNDVAQPGQFYSVSFNASQLASGIYFYVLSTP